MCLAEMQFVQDLTLLKGNTVEILHLCAEAAMLKYKACNASLK